MNAVTQARDLLQLKPVADLSEEDKAEIMQHVKRVRSDSGVKRLLYGRIGMIPITNVSSMSGNVIPQFGIVKIGEDEFVLLYPYNSGYMNGGDEEGPNWFVDSSIVNTREELFDRIAKCCAAYVQKETDIRNRVGGDDMMGALDL